VTAALVAMVLPLIQGQSEGWPLWTYASFVLAAILFAGFVAYQRWLAGRGGAPLIDLSIFASRGFAVGMVTQFTFWIGQASFFLILALFLQQGRGLSALHSGVVFTAIGAGYLATSTTAGRIAERLGRQTVAVGTVIMALGLLVMLIAVRATGTTGNVAWLVPGLIIDGLGMGMALSPLASTALSFVPVRHAGAGSGVLSTGMQVGGAVGVAVIGVIFYRALAHGFPAAFGAGLVFLIVVELLVAVLIQFLPRAAR
jgi:predicted MFS family arabinose efflux permease